MTSILIPPGIGDQYWVLVKLQSFMRREQIRAPKITVVCTPDDQWKGHLRSIPFLKRFSFLKIADPSWVANDPELYPQYLEAYSRIGQTIWPNFQGFDYFIAYNGILNGGGSLETADIDLACNWYPQMTYSQIEMDTAKQYREKYGKYVCFYWPFFGTFENHIREYPIENIVKAIKLFLTEFDATPIFIGSQTDVGINDLLIDLMSQFPEAVDLVGKLSLDETFGVVKGSEMVVGYHSGLTNMAVVFKKKTILLWSNYLPKSIALNCVPPDRFQKTYFPLYCQDIDVDKFYQTMCDVYRS